MTNRVFYWSIVISDPFITFFEPPSALTNPVSVTVLEGAPIRLNATFGGTSNTYQWRHYSTPLVNGGRVSGAQSNYLTITGALLSDAGAYSLVASNPAGVASLTAAVIVQPVSLTNQLIAHWKFDETTGALADEATGLSQDGALSNFPGDNSQWVPGIIGRALSFSDPTNQNYVIASDYAKPTNTMSLSVWVWAVSRPTSASIAKNWGPGQAGQFQLGLQANSGRLSNLITDDSGASVSALDPAQLPLESWQNVAFVADGARMRLYRNGVEVAVSALYNGTLIAPPMAGLGIGVATDNSGTGPAIAPGYWHGKLDDLGIWGRALSADEVFGLYLAGQSGKGIDQASAVQPVTLTVFVTGDQVTIQYAAGTLQWADDVMGAWIAVPGASAPSFTTTATLKKFFRVR